MMPDRLQSYLAIPKGQPNYHNHPKRFGCGTQTGQASKREYNRLLKLVNEGKACWWRRWKTLEEIENSPL